MACQLCHHAAAIDCAKKLACEKLEFARGWQREGAGWKDPHCAVLAIYGAAWRGSRGCVQALGLWQGAKELIIYSQRDALYRPSNFCHRRKTILGVTCTGVLSFSSKDSCFEALRQTFCSTCAEHRSI